MALDHTRSGPHRRAGMSRDKLEGTWLVEFEWDTNKDASNKAKHGITFSEAATIFGDPLELTIPDPSHSHEEFRWISLGQSSTGALLVVSFTERKEGRIRIVSARPANRHERQAYERHHRK